MAVWLGHHRRVARVVLLLLREVRYLANHLAHRTVGPRRPIDALRRDHSPIRTRPSSALTLADPTTTHPLFQHKEIREAISLIIPRDLLAVPLNRRDGSFFGILCALDPLPADLAEEDLDIFHLSAQLIAFELEADEQSQRRDAETRMLEDFITMAAHDLRQPLTALGIRAQLLARTVRKTPGAEILTDRVDGLIQDIGRATALSETLLDIAHVESGGLVIEQAEFDLIVLIQEVLPDVRSLAPGHALRMDMPDALTNAA